MMEKIKENTMKNGLLSLALTASLLFAFLLSGGTIALGNNESNKTSSYSEAFSSMAPNEGDIKEVWPEPEMEAEEAVASNKTAEPAPGFDLFSGLSLMAALYILAVKKAKSPK
jgi:hypothetical protein